MAAQLIPRVQTAVNRYLSSKDAVEETELFLSKPGCFHNYQAFCKSNLGMALAILIDSIGKNLCWHSWGLTKEKSETGSFPMEFTEAKFDNGHLLELDANSDFLKYRQSILNLRSKGKIYSISDLIRDNHDKSLLVCVHIFEEPMGKDVQFSSYQVLEVGTTIALLDFQPVSQTDLHTLEKVDEIESNYEEMVISELASNSRLSTNCDLLLHDVDRIKRILVAGHLQDRRVHFMYWFPSYYFLGGKRLVSGIHSVGTIKPLSLEKVKEQYIGFQLLMRQVDAIRGAYIASRHSRKSAVAAIMSRNMSHNIGSHVSPRTSLEKINERLENMDFNRRFDVIKLLKGKLDDYIQKKSDFLAEITTEPLATTKPVLFYREVILPFIENTLLMDNIAANEGVNYKVDDNKALVDNRLKIRVFINGKELKATYSCEASGGCIYSYPDSLPYSFHCLEHSKQLQVQRIENGDNDVEIELPGPLGEFAFYGLLENYIRNVAKHDKKNFEEEMPLEITIEVNDTKEEKEKAEFYQIEIFNNVTDPNETVGQIVDAKRKVLIETLNDYISSDIIEFDGKLKRQAWGIAEMKICATLLRGSADFNKLSQCLVVGSKSSYEGNPRLAYCFNLMKSRKLCAVIHGWNDHQKSKFLQKNGIWIFPSVAELKNHLITTESFASFRFALFDHKDKTNHCEGLKELPKLLPQLPFRIIVLTDNQVSQSLPEEIQSLVISRRLLVVNKELDLNKTSEEIECWLWQHWIQRWFQNFSGSVKATLEVYLDQNCGDEPTKQWSDVAEAFNHADYPLKLRVWSKAGYCNKIEGVNETQIFYDRHGGGIMKSSFQSDFLGEHSYVFLDKLSSDFARLFWPSFPTGKNQKMWTFPWQLAEAGLLRILFVDERLAERAYDEIDDLDAIAIRKKMGLESGYPTRWHLAWAAKVYICTHFGINDNVIPLHKSIEQQKGESPFLKVQVDWHASESKPAPIRYDWKVNEKQQNGLNVDMLIIHQGVLDGMKDTLLQFDQDEFLTILQKQIPFVLVDSGRGVPHTLSNKEKFLPFSLIQDYMFGPRIAKYSLARVTMSLTRQTNG